MTLTQGHAFVVQGDLNLLVCDEALIPTDRWLDLGAQYDPLEPLHDRHLLPRGWSTGTVRVTDRLTPVDGLPARRMVNSGATEHDPVDWLMNGVDQALAAVVSGLTGTTSTIGRALPLLDYRCWARVRAASRLGAARCWTDCWLGASAWPEMVGWTSPSSATTGPTSRRSRPAAPSCPVRRPAKSRSGSAGWHGAGVWRSSWEPA